MNGGGREQQGALCSWDRVREHPTPANTTGFVCQGIHYMIVLVSKRKRESTVPSLESGF